MGSDPAGPTLVDLLATPADQADSESIRRDDAEQVKAVMDELSPPLREILLLSYFHRMSYAQIAEALDIPLGTVKSRLHSAVASFATLWRRRTESSDESTS